MADIFISYSSADRERAGILADALTARGWSVWWDRQIVPGQSFDSAIERELQAAGCVVVLWSKSSVDSEWVKNEAAAAVERGVLVPARIDDIGLPFEFRRKQTADLVGWNGSADHGGLLALCAGVAATIGNAMPPSPVAPAVASRARRHWLLPVAGAVAVALGLLAYWLTSRLPPAAETAPRIALAPDVTDELGRPVNRAGVPFKIRVKGSASGVERHFVYLVVDDSTARWIEPTNGLGTIVGNEFSGLAYLGEEKSPDSLGKLYKVYAVATDRQYAEFEHLDPRTVKAASSAVEVVRTR